MNLYKTWSDHDRTVTGESCMFAGTRQANVLFPIKKILRVYQPQSGFTYQEGIDFLWEEGKNILDLTEHSRIPTLPREQLFPAKEDAILYPAPGNNAIGGGPDHTLLRFDNKDFFARNQIEIDYEAATIDFPDSLLDDQTQKLPEFRKKLIKKQPVEVVHLGDSISDGFNASAFVGIPPFKPTWSQQFISYLQEKYDIPVQYRNFAINGATCLSALDMRAMWINRPADLVIIAYGMNDLGLGNRVFLDVHRLLISLIQRFNPAAEILLVATMAANPIWKTVNPKLLQEQHDGLTALAKEYGDHAAIANVYDIWQECVRRKGYYSMTGNGVNHPNDFGHKIYMGVLEKIL